MEFLKSYAQNISIASVMLVIFEMIMPSDVYKKYADIAISLVFIMIVLSPIKNFINLNESFTIDLPSESNIELKFDTDKIVLGEFEKNLEKKIKEDLADKLGKEVSVKVYAECEGELVAITKIDLFPCSDDVIYYVSENYGVKEEQIGVLNE